jgi:hypothetical protein
VAPRTGTEERYAAAMGELWSGLARTLTRLDIAAAAPDALEDDGAGTALRRLQYSLHLAAEHAYGLDPPDEEAGAHAELADALTCARDATADVAEAVSVWGADGVRPFLHEWRGALFRVRLARLRLATPVARKDTPGELREDGITRPLVAFLLALFGALTFVAGATFGLWPVWSAGALAVCASVVAYRP